MDLIVATRGLAPLVEERHVRGNPRQPQPTHIRTSNPQYGNSVTASCISLSFNATAHSPVRAQVQTTSVPGHIHNTHARTHARRHTHADTHTPSAISVA